MANSVDSDQTALGAVCSGSTLFDSILNSSVMLGNYLQQTTSADDICRCIFFLALSGLNFKGGNNRVAEQTADARAGLCLCPEREREREREREWLTCAQQIIVIHPYFPDKQYIWTQVKR